MTIVPGEEYGRTEAGELIGPYATRSELDAETAAANDERRAKMEIVAKRLEDEGWPAAAEDLRDGTPLWVIERRIQDIEREGS